MMSNTVTLKLVGGIPLADLSFDPGLGLNVSPGGAPLIASTTFAISDLSIGLTVEHFNAFAGISLKPDLLYWIDITSTSSSSDYSFVTWGLTSDVSGVGVAENYNSSDATDFGFFLNHGAPPFAADLAFQMEVSGTAPRSHQPGPDDASRLCRPWLYGFQTPCDSHVGPNLTIHRRGAPLFCACMKPRTSAAISSALVSSAKWPASRTWTSASGTSRR